MTRRHITGSLAATLALACCGALPSAAQATRIGDITHLKGVRNNRIVGIGLVTGLAGKGDGGKFMPAIRPLQQLLANFSNPSALEELKDANNVAIVSIEVVLPEYGVREGDALDVRVTAIGSAKTLVGGSLFISPLQGPSRNTRQIFAFASGPLEVPDPKGAPTRAIVRRGATMERDVIHHFIADGAITLVLNDAHAGFAMAAAIAQIVNESQSERGRSAQAARAIDAKNVVVMIPPEYLGDPADFIADVESLDLLMPAGEARIVINRIKGTIVVTGEINISPMVFAQDGLTIETLNPPPQGTPDAPVVTTDNFALLDTSGRKSAKLTDLLAALNRLRVPAGKTIDLIETMSRSGHIHARLIYEE